MEFQHINAKIFVDGKLPFDPSRFINVFHQWIQEQAVPELLIDVADYCHVPEGPGVLLVAHEADYSMDNADGRWGLRYNRKSPVTGSNDVRFRQAISSAANACLLLEKLSGADGGAAEPIAPLRFSRTEFEIFVNDRALAPNTPETNAAFRTDMQSCLSKLLGHNEFTMTSHSDPRRLVGAIIACSRPFKLEILQALLAVA